MKLLSKEG